MGWLGCWTLEMRCVATGGLIPLMEADVYVLQRDWDTLKEEWEIVCRDMVGAGAKFVKEVEGIEDIHTEV